MWQTACCGSFYNAARSGQEERRGWKKNNRHIAAEVPAQSTVHKDFKRWKAQKGSGMYQMPKIRKGG